MSSRATPGPGSRRGVRRSPVPGAGRYLRRNRELWNDLTDIHVRSAFYDVAGFKAGRSTLHSIELAELADVSGKSLLHLQCHFGLDSLSWARLGARVTGVDFADRAIEVARDLSRETGIPAEFIRADVYELPRVLDGTFDIVFASYGVLCWLPDLGRWAEVVARYVRPGGVFYLVDDHPMATIFDNSSEAKELAIVEPYFWGPEPMAYEPEGSYADRSARIEGKSYEWTHDLGEVVSMLIAAGLRIEFLHEFPVCAWQRFPFMRQDDESWWVLEGDPIPLTFSVRARKDG